MMKKTALAIIILLLACPAAQARRGGPRHGAVNSSTNQTINALTGTYGQITTMNSTETNTTNLNATGTSVLNALQVNSLDIAGDWVQQMPDDVWPDKKNAIGQDWTYPFFFAYDLLPYFRSSATTTYDLTTGAIIPYADTFSVDYDSIEDSECWAASDAGNAPDSSISKTFNGNLLLYDTSSGDSIAKVYYESSQGNCIDFNPDDKQVTATFYLRAGPKAGLAMFGVIDPKVIVGFCGSGAGVVLGAGFNYGAATGLLSNWVVQGGNPTVAYDTGVAATANELLKIDVGFKEAATSSDNFWGISMASMTTGISVTAITGTTGNDFGGGALLGSPITDYTDLKPCMFYYADGDGTAVEADAVSVTKLWWRIAE